MNTSHSSSHLNWQSSDQLFSFSIDSDATDYLMQIVQSPYLKVFIRKGGCSGSMYGFEEKNAIDTENHYLIKLSDTLCLAVEKKEAQEKFQTLVCQSKKSLGGLILQWSHKTSGFVCGCGESFES